MTAARGASQGEFRGDGVEPAARGVSAGAALLGLVLSGCALAPIDYEGKACPTGVCPGDLVCVEQACRASAAVADGGSDASADAGVTRGFLVVQLAGPADDATWDLSAERLVALDFAVEVGSLGRTSFGVRFALPFPPRTRLLEARLEVMRLTGTATTSEGYTVRVWNDLDVPVFDDTHVHVVEFHSPSGFRPGAVPFSLDWHPYSQSDDLAALLQPLLDRPDWHRDAIIGLAVVADPGVTTWAGVADYTVPPADGFSSRLAISFEY